MGNPQSDSGRIVLNNVTFGYDPAVPVLAGLTMVFPRTGLVMVKAANGAGKSTLVELISGHIRPQAGEVWVCGSLAETGQARALRRVVRSEPALYPTMSVYDHLAFTSMLAGVSVDRALARVARYRLEEWLDVRANELSAGTARKLWLIMCTLGDFEVVVLDEPFTGLDDQARSALLSELEEHRSLGNLAVVVTHEHPAGFHPDSIVGLERADPTRTFLNET